MATLSPVAVAGLSKQLDTTSRDFKSTLGLSQNMVRRTLVDDFNSEIKFAKNHRLTRSRMHSVFLGQFS